MSKLRQERDCLQFAGLRRRHALLHQMDRSAWPLLWWSKACRLRNPANCKRSLSWRSLDTLLLLSWLKVTKSTANAQRSFIKRSLKKRGSSSSVPQDDGYDVTNFNLIRASTHKRPALVEEPEGQGCLAHSFVRENKENPKANRASTCIPVSYGNWRQPRSVVMMQLQIK